MKQFDLEEYKKNEKRNNKEEQVWKDKSDKSLK